MLRHAALRLPLHVDMFRYATRVFTSDARYALMLPLRYFMRDYCLFFYFAASAAY